MQYNQSLLSASWRADQDHCLQPIEPDCKICLPSNKIAQSNQSAPLHMVKFSGRGQKTVANSGVSIHLMFVFLLFINRSYQYLLK